ncbi:monocarboxylate transporter 13-like [Diadema antillarum]|uniref:monocarboxylate transporter 13-like n=1 Tax=Diadema antillarum TaxID=105358 RepID=UPI003A8A74D8
MTNCKTVSSAWKRLRPCQNERRDKMDAGKKRATASDLWNNPQYFRWITTAMWAISGAFTFGVVGDFSLLFIYLEEDLNASVFALNWMGTIPWILFSVCSPLSTVLLRKIGYRATLAGSCALGALGLLATSFCTQVWQMYITYSVIFGGCSVIHFVAGCVYVTCYFDQGHCAGPVSSMGFTFETSILVFSPVIQITAETWGWRWTVRLLSTFTLTAATLLVFFIRPPPRDLTRRIAHRASEEGKCKPPVVDSDVEPRLLDEKGDVDDELEKTTISICQRCARILSIPAFWFLQVASLVSFTALSFNHINLGSYLKSIGISSQLTATLHSFLAGGALVGRASVMLFTHKLPVPITSLYPFIAMANCILTVLILVTAVHGVLYLYATAVGFLRALFLSLAMGMAVELFGRDFAAEAYNGVFCTWGIASILAAIIPGITYDTTGSYRVSVLTCAIFWGCSAVFYGITFLVHRRSTRRVDGRGSLNNEDVETKSLTKQDLRTTANTVGVDDENDASTKEVLLVTDWLTTV